MSLALVAPISWPVSLLKSKPEGATQLSAEEQLDTVFLSEPLWAKAAETAAAGSDDKLAISVVPSSNARGAGPANAAQSLVCWARQFTGDSSQAAEDTIYVTPRLFSRYPALFRPPPALLSQSPPKPCLSVSAVRTTPVLSLYLLALSSSAFAFSRSDHHALESRFSGRIVRQGEEYVVREGEGEGGELRFKAVMCEPLLQGTVRAGKTRFFVSFDPAAASASSPTGRRLADGAVSHVDGHVCSEGGEGRDDDDDGDDGDEVDSLEIDENFLARSILHDSASPSLSPEGPNGTIPHGPSHATVLDGSASHIAASDDGLSFVVEVMERRRFDEDVGIGVGEVDEEATAFVAPSWLAKMGVFNGDWAIAAATDASNARLVRIYSAGDLPSSPPTVRLSPTLAFNLDPALPSSSPSRVFLRPPRSPSSSSSSIASFIPAALSLNIARLASPHSVDRTYQTLFLEALKLYFEGRKRICRDGDVIAVAIEEGRLRFKKLREDGNEGEEEQDDYELPFSTPTRTAAVFFKIASMTIDAAQSPSGARAGSNGKAAVSYDEDSVAVRSGSLGCWVDPRVTKMVQTGVVHGRVPDVQAWLGIASTTPPCPLPSTPLSAPSSPYSVLYDLMRATLTSRALDYGLNLSVLLKGARGSGKKTLAQWVARGLGVHLLEINCFDLVGDTDVRTEGKLRARFDKAVSCAPCIFLLRNVDALAKKSQALETGQEPAMASILQDCFATARTSFSSSGFPVIVIGTTTDVDKLAAGVVSCFKQEIAIEAPGEAERLEILRTVVSRTTVGPDVSLRALATQTAALVAGDLVDLVDRAKLSAMDRLLKIRDTDSSLTEMDCLRAGIALTGADFSAALNKSRSSYSESIGAPKIPNVTWDDVGGLANVKADILDTIQLPLEHPELFADGLKKRSGVLLYGPPGTGKTLLAKAVATSCSLNFFSVKGPELLNMYIGESEANVRRVFQRARDAKPCVIFFDELDSVAPKRGNQGDSGGVMDRIVSQLLAELDGMAEGKKGGDVFVIGATNRPDLLDPALLRPGRFDRLLYLGVSDTHESQLKIIQALTRKFKLDADVGDLSVVANRCPFHYTGADFYALCSDAMLKAMTRKAEEIDETIARLNAKPPPYDHPHPLTPQYYLAELATPSEIEVRVSLGDFEAALRELVPSVSQAEMEHYKSVQARFQPEKAKEDDEEKRTSDKLGRGGETWARREERSVARAYTIDDGDGMGSMGAAGEEEEEEEAERRREAKGKGKERE